MKKILIIDDDTYICNLLENFLKQKGFETSTAYTGNSGLEKLRKEKISLILCDFRLPDADGIKMLTKIKEINNEVPVIFITAYADVRVAVQLMKMGAKDYVTKPIYHEEILQIVKKTINDDPKPRKVEVDDRFIMGESSKIKEIMRMIELVAPTDMTVLIEGETGSGKEFIARSIHHHSQRKNKPFVAVDCGAIPKDLANSELFGHIKGSFTGAINDKKGVFEQANGGTLFLDEIGNLTLDVQIKFLRALQERVITRIGDTKSIKIDLRIIVATNEDLMNEVKDGKFREDLYHRVNEFKIDLPPLRERKDDILIFANHFMMMANDQLGKNVSKFDTDVVEILLNYPWHGNLRELKNVIKRGILMTNSDTMTLGCLPEEIRTVNPTEARKVAATYGSPERDPLNLKEASIEAEKEIILNALREANYNKSKAAKILDIDRKTLYNKIHQYDINIDI
jgi:two-component system response regulator HydG